MLARNDETEQVKVSSALEDAPTNLTGRLASCNQSSPASVCVYSNKLDLVVTSGPALR